MSIYILWCIHSWLKNRIRILLSAHVVLHSRAAIQRSPPTIPNAQDRQVAN